MKFPSNLKQHFKIIKEEGIPVESLFIVHGTPWKERFVRTYLSQFVNSLPLPVGYSLTTLFKRIRNPSRRLVLRYPLDFPECRIIAGRLKGKGLKPWWGKSSVVCISHDVDNIEGYNFIRTMAEIDYKYGVRSTFNFLTHDYKVEKELVKSLERRKFEVGLHGCVHDQGFAFRGYGLIRQRIGKALSVLDGVKIFGYRSPALSLSKDLFMALGKSRILFDSSLQVASPFYHSVRLPYPIFLKEYGIWEIPLMIQDDNYMRDTDCEKKAMFDSLARLVKDTQALNGVFVINMHPHIMAKKGCFYEEFVSFMKSFDDVAFASTKEVALYVEGDADNSR